MPATLFLIRHGQTPNHAAKRFRGAESGGDLLDATGHEEAEALAQALGARKLPRPRIFASTALRAQQTGQHLADALLVPLHLLPGVHEIGTGDWAGRPYSDMQTFRHELVAPDGHFGFPGGESLAAVGERFRAALLGLQMQEDEFILVVSHGVALASVLAKLLGRDARAAWIADEFKHANSAVTELRWKANGRPDLVRLADTSHLTGRQPG